MVCFLFSLLVEWCFLDVIGVPFSLVEGVMVNGVLVAGWVEQKWFRVHIPSKEAMVKLTGFLERCMG